MPIRDLTPVGGQPAISTKSTLFLATGLCGLLVCLLLWFHYADFYHNRFFDHGACVPLYQALRLVFAVYLAWLVYAPGMGVLVLTGCRGALKDLPALERYLLAFLTGAGLWHAVLFAVGLAGLYLWPAAMMLVLSVMALSVPHLADCLRGTVTQMQKLKECPPSSARLLLWGLLGTVAVMFLLVKGTYPAGGHDYYNHYFQFYKRVVETGSILPNDVWYHFYYSKGAGLYFLSMLLTDPLAPQLVGTVFFFTAAGMLVALLRRAGDASSPLPIVGAILYIFYFIYTPGPAINKANGGWGDLEKLHELTAALMFGVVWITARLPDYDALPARPWVIALCCTVLTVVLITFPLAVLIGIYMGLLFLWFAWKKKHRSMKRLAIAMTATGCTALSILCINYHYTGLPLDQLLLPFWSFANLETLRHWGVLFEVLGNHQALTGLAATPVPWTWGILPVFAGFLRLDVWWPLLKWGVLLTVAAYFYKRASPSAAPGSESGNIGYALGIYILAVLLFAAMAGGRSQFISFYRFSSFSYGPVLALIMLLWLYALTLVPQERKAIVRKIAIAALMVSCVMPIRSTWGIHNFRALLHGDIHSFGDIGSIFSEAASLWEGDFSLKDAYQHQNGWPGRMPDGGIYPGVEMPWKIAGPHTRIWSFHVHSYCMLPDCNMQGFASFRFSPHWQTVYFDTSAHAAAVLHAEGLDYFFFSRELSFHDTLPDAPLFSPEHIGEYLGIRWTDGTSYLLTWKGRDTQPVDQGFLAAYRAAIKKSSAVEAFSVSDWKRISDHINRHADDLRPFRLPWCTTCDTFPLEPLMDSGK